MRDRDGTWFCGGTQTRFERLWRCAALVGPSADACLAARHYLLRVLVLPPPCRFDVVVVEPTGLQWLWRRLMPTERLVAGGAQPPWGAVFFGFDVRTVSSPPEQRIEQHFIDSAEAFEIPAAQTLSKPIAAAVQAILACHQWRQGAGFGNGGSLPMRSSFRLRNLWDGSSVSVPNWRDCATTDTPSWTGHCQRLRFQQRFSRQVRALGGR